MRAASQINREESVFGSLVLVLSLFALLIAFSFTTNLPTRAQSVISARGQDQGSYMLAETDACLDSGGVNCVCQGRISGYVQYEGAQPRPYLRMNGAERRELARAQSAQRCGDSTGRFN